MTCPSAVVSRPDQTTTHRVRRAEPHRAARRSVMFIVTSRQTLNLFV